MTPCSKCRRRPRKSGQRVCGPCHAAYMRAWRKRHHARIEAEVERRVRRRLHLLRKMGVT